jgi:hypothetical protein
MTRSCLLALLLAGCPYNDDDDSGGGGEAPRIEASAPGAALVTVQEDGDAMFSAQGVDDDSLHLDWSWTLGEDYLGGGTSEDGAFDALLPLPWSEDRRALSTELRFAVSDGDRSAERLWAVDFE